MWWNFAGNSAEKNSLFLPFEHQERAERLFETKGKNLSELPKDMFAKQKPGKGKNEKTEKLKEIALEKLGKNQWLLRDSDFMRKLNKNILVKIIQEFIP